MLDEGWVPLVDDPYTWRELGGAWVINVQQRVADKNELFFGRYTTDDRTLVVTRSAADTAAASSARDSTCASSMRRCSRTATFRSGRCARTSIAGSRRGAEAGIARDRGRAGSPHHPRPECFE